MAAPTTEIGSFVKPKGPGGVAAIQDFMKVHGVAPADAGNNTPVAEAPDAAKTFDPLVAAKADADVPPSAPASMDELAFETAIAAAEQSAELTYEDRIKKFGLTLPDAVGIIDTMLVKGTYEKTYPVTSKIKVTFRTRSVEDNDKMAAKLEKDQPAFNLSLSGLISKHNLASSLVSLGTTKFGNTTEDREKALRFVSALPGHIFALLVNKLAKFDQMVSTVLDEGSIENF